MAKKTYNELLRDPRWQKRRLDILNRDQFTCTQCGDKETELHIHHEYYTKGTLPWEYPDDGLITLCAHCHYAITELLTFEYVILKVAKSRSQNNSHLVLLYVLTDAPKRKVLHIYLFGHRETGELLASLPGEHIVLINQLFDYKTDTKASF